MVGYATVDGGAAIGCGLGHVWRHVERAHVGHEIGRIEALFGTDGNALAPGE